MKYWLKTICSYFQEQRILRACLLQISISLAVNFHHWLRPSGIALDALWWTFLLHSSGHKELILQNPSLLLLSLQSDVVSMKGCKSIKIPYIIFLVGNNNICCCFLILQTVDQISSRISWTAKIVTGNILGMLLRLAVKSPAREGTARLGNSLLEVCCEMSYGRVAFWDMWSLTCW